LTNQGTDSYQEEEVSVGRASLEGPVLINPDNTWAGERAYPPDLHPGKRPPTNSDGVALDPTLRCVRYVTNSVGFRICGQPVLAGTDHCRDHALRVVEA
jgi:hypothetical protein